MTGKASTAIDPELGRAIDQKISAEGRVEDLTLALGSPLVVLGIGAANSVATAGCAAGAPNQPRFVGDSRVADITLNGTLIPLDRLVAALSQALSPLGFLVEITPDERIVEPNESLTSARCTSRSCAARPRSSTSSSARPRSARTDRSVTQPAG